MKWIVNLAFGVVVSAALLYAFWRSLGAMGLVYAMPVLAVLGKPLVEIGASLPRLAARIAMRKFEGRYYEFRGRSMDIHIDPDARCWVSTADVRKVTPLPADLVLNRMVPQECRQLGDPLQWRITPEGLSRVLAKSSDPDVTKFCHWLEKDVARPARNRRDGRKVPG